MKTFILGLFIGLSVSAIAVEVVIMDYDSVDYDTITVYPNAPIYDPCYPENSDW